MSNPNQSKANLIKKDLELIKKEEAEFTQRLIKELAILAQDRIGFYLPIVVIDHIADTECNLSFIESRVKGCAREGVEEGDGLQLFKIRRVPVRAEVKDRMVIRTEVMMLVQCQLFTAHQAIYRPLNQTAATRLRIGVYVFDRDGCQYPYRTMCSEPIDTRLFANNARVNKSIANPVFIDIKEDRARIEDRPHVSKIQGGYPVASLIGTTDIPRYRELTPPSKPLKPSTHDKSSDLSFEEGSINQNQPPKVSRVQTPKNSAASVPQPTDSAIHSTKSNPSPAQARDYRSVLITEPIQAPQVNRIFVEETIYPNKPSVFNSLGSTKPASSENAR